VNQLIGGGGNLWSDNIEHARGKYPNRAAEASRIMGQGNIQHSTFNAQFSASRVGDRRSEHFEVAR